MVPEHQNYQVRLTRFLADRGVRAEMEKDFVDVSFSAGGQDFIGEIKVTRICLWPRLSVPLLDSCLITEIYSRNHLQ